ncbi:E2F transcription factor-like E2FF isoform X2 [Nymphaea colorata]|uniref:E2F transcription factor-like E2FF isoform X2 n=1 Tax=Nymphaea colorata TaxID=210225 RepID=UPI00129D58ED|nr:E2F transcription factor-like E2FF isoform X2 [Nymphaea colorata]
MSSSLSKDLHARHYTYNRKEKSLGLLCQNFLSLYNREGVESVGLDEAASRLGVERRRIYDIVNVLESVGVLARKAKNQYSWKGFGGIPQALAKLRDETTRETSTSTLPIASDDARISDDEEDENSSNPNSSQEFPLKCSPSSVLLVPATSNSSSTKIKSERRREKSLGLLTQNFVKLFLSSKAEIVSLEEAAVLLLGEASDSLQLRTKVRRLYDIANVLSSMNLIEKTHHSVTRKPAFRWLGVDEKSEKDSSHAIFSDIPKGDAKKREFGTELCPNTDIDAKRRKLFSGIHALKPRRENVVNLEVSDDKARKQSQQQQYCQKYEQQKENISSKGFVYGPFSPVCVAQKNSESSSKGAQDWDALAASFFPQYKNQALSDLFSHYLEAWQSWYAQVASGGGDRSHLHSS